MKKKMLFLFIVVFMFFCYQIFGREVDDFEEKQYSKYYQIFGKPLDARLPILDQVIAIKPSSKWAGKAMIEKARIYLIRNDFAKAKEIAGIVNAKYGDLIDTYGIIRIPRGWYDVKTENRISEMTKKYPIRLGDSAQLLIAEVYMKTGKNDEAVQQLKTLVENKTTLSGIRSDLESEEELKLLKDNWWPQQKALTMLMKVYEEQGNYRAAAEIGEEVLQYGNYRDVDIGERKLIDYRIKLKEFKKAQELIEKRMNKTEDKKEKEDLNQKLKMVIEKQK